MKYAIAVKNVLTINPPQPVFGGPVFEALTKDAIIMTAINKALGIRYYNVISHLMDLAGKIQREEISLKEWGSKSTEIVVGWKQMGLQSGELMLITNSIQAITKTMAKACEQEFGHQDLSLIDLHQLSSIIKSVACNFYAVLISTVILGLYEGSTHVGAATQGNGVEVSSLISASLGEWAAQDPPFLKIFEHLVFGMLGIERAEHFVTASDFSATEILQHLKRGGLTEALDQLECLMDDRTRLLLFKTFHEEQVAEDNAYLFTAIPTADVLMVDEEELEKTLRSLMEKKVAREEFATLLTSDMARMVKSRNLTYSSLSLQSTLMGLEDLKSEEVEHSCQVMVRPLGLKLGLDLGPFSQGNEWVALDEQFIEKVKKLSSEVFEDNSDDFMSFMEAF